MSRPENEIIVTQIAGYLAAADCDGPEQAQKLVELGFVEHETWAGFQWERKITDDDDRKKLVQTFINMDALFSAGREWSPEELVSFYSEEGFVKGKYRVIAWYSLDRYQITTVPEMRRCPHCGAGFSRVGYFCGKCGTKV